MGNMTAVLKRWYQIDTDQMIRTLYFNFSSLYAVGGDTIPDALIASDVMPYVSGSPLLKLDHMFAELVQTRAAITLTSNGTNVNNNDAVTIGTRTYTFKTALTGAADEIKIAASAALSLVNLQNAINSLGVPGTNYGSPTSLHEDVEAGAITGTTLELMARIGGTIGNAFVSTTTASPRLSFPAGGTFNAGTPGGPAGWSVKLDRAAKKMSLWDGAIESTAVDRHLFQVECAFLHEETHEVDDNH